LEYASQRTSTTPFNWTRPLWLALAICLPPIACYTWATLSIDWLYRQPWWHSGQPWEGIYRPLFIERPWKVCTMVMALEAMFVVAMVVLRRWRVLWLAAIPCGFVVWMIFNVMMFMQDEGVFP
jgi:hypothetical protein